MSDQSIPDRQGTAYPSGSPMDAPPTDGLSALGILVQKGDPNRFQTALFAGTADREILFTLYAFHLEMAKLAEGISEPLIARMRIQWWQDAFDRLCAGSPLERDHPIAEALVTHIPTDMLSSLRPCLNAREADLLDAPFGDLNAMEAYCRETAGILTQMAAARLGAEDPDVLEAAGHLGTAWGLLGQLRAAPFQARRGRLVIPLDQAAGAGLGVQDLDGRSRRPGVADAIGAISRAVVERVNALQDQGRKKRVPKRVLPAVLHARLTDAYSAEILKEPGFLDRPEVGLPKRMPFALAWALFRKRP